MEIDEIFYFVKVDNIFTPLETDKNYRLLRNKTFRKSFQKLRNNFVKVVHFIKGDVYEIIFFVFDQILSVCFA